MAITIIVLLVLLLLVVGFAYPWVIMAALLATPLLKTLMTAYVPAFQAVDFTVVVCGLALLVGLWNYFRHARIGRPIAIPWAMLICMVILASLLFAGMAWTTAPNYGWMKVTRFAGIAIPFLILPSFYVRSKKDGHAMIRMVILVGTVAAVMLILMPKSILAEEQWGRQFRRATLLGASPGAAAQLIGLGVLTLMTAFIIKGSATRFLRYSALIVLPVSLLAILMSGSRGSLLYLLFVAPILPFFAGRRDRARGFLLWTPLLPLALIVIFHFWAASGAALAQRWTDFFEKRGLTIEGRTPHWLFVLQNWSTRPILGHGSGSFAMDWGGGDARHFPHNIILEALYETGLVGTIALLLFFIFVAQTVIRGLRQIPEDSPHDRYLVVAPLAMVMFMTLRGMSSVDLEGMRFLYLCVGLMYANVSQLVYANRETALAGAMGAPEPASPTPTQPGIAWRNTYSPNRW